MRALRYDVAILGAGSAGLAAAITAAELGATVGVLEKTAEPGGVIRGGSGLFAVESTAQRERQVALTRAEAFAAFMEFTQWRVDARLVSAYINRSAQTVAWLERMGAGFSDVVPYYRGAHRTWHFKDPDAPDLAEVLLRRAKELGVEIHLDTAAREIRREDGAVTGVAADGALLEAGAVIVATGGFGGDPDLIREHTGYEYGVDLFSFAHPRSAGDGLRMARAAGAAAGPACVETYVCLPAPYWGPGGTPPELGSFRQPNLMVNQHGERFMNEEVMRHPAFAGNAVHRQKGGCAYMILDAAANDRYLREGWDVLMSNLPVRGSIDLEPAVAQARRTGYPHLFAAGSLPELAAGIGVDAARLERALSEYNCACAVGRDDLFHKHPDHLRPLTEPPYYAARFSLGGYGSRGGIAVNHRTEVVDEHDDPIPGLYAAGNDANAIYGGTYPFHLAGNSSAFAYNSGRMAGEHATDYVRTLA